MTDISFACAHCKQHLEAPSEMAGAKIACPTCQKEIQIPTAEPVKLTPECSPLGARLAAGLIGGLILAVLASNIAEALFSDVSSKEPSTAVNVLAGIIFLGLLVASVVFAIKAQRAAKVWRRLLISNACLSFAMPVTGFIMMGKAAYHYETKGRQLEAAAMAGAGGIVAFLLGILGFFLGAIFLTVGLLVGRDKQKAG